MSRTAKVVLGVLVLAAAGGAASYQALRAERGVEVRVDVVSEREVVSTITATGQVRARRQVNISSDVMGRVTELLVEEGSEVEEGDVLLSIDPSQIRAAVSRARASLSQAEAQVAQQRANLFQAERELARLRGIAERDSALVSRQSLEEAETRLEVQGALLRSALHGAEQAQAGLDEAGDQLNRTTIRAPISGRVIRLNIEQGETAVVGTMNNPGSLLLTIGDLSAIEAVLAVDETDVPRIAVGDSALVELDAFPDKLFEASVTSIGNSAIQGGVQPAAGGAAASVDFEVILTLFNPPTELRPDLSATADIIVDRVANAVTVPIVAVTVAPLDSTEIVDDEAEAGPADEGEAPSGPLARSLEPAPVEGVFLARAGRAVWAPVVLGLTGQEHFEVLSGVSLGDSVVSGPYQAIQDLADGDEVRIVTGMTAAN
jgi:HlyD family secretion protein